MRVGLAAKVEPGPDGVNAATPAAEDAQLLARLAGGDMPAFRRVVDRYLPHLLAVGRRMLRDDAEAEDIAQEALMRLWRSAGTLELGPGGLRPWLTRVTSNLCIDRIRSARNTSVVEEVPEMPEPAGQLRHLTEQELSGAVDKALKELPERQRLALTLFHYEGLSQVEVGQILGVSDEAVESLLARARRALRAVLKDDWQQLLPENEQ